MLTKEKYFIVLFLFGAIIPSAFGQWAPIPTGTTTKYESLYFFDAMNGVAASWGKVLRTANGGDTWSIVNVSGVRDIDFANTNVGFVAGVSGSAIKKTTNGGLNWTALTPINSSSLWGVSVPDENTVYVCGVSRIIWKSTNGGLNFTVASLPPPGDLVVDIDFSSPTTGVALEQSSVWKTTNGGASWVNTFSIPSVSFTSIYFIDVLNGFAVGSAGTIIKTTNGGSNWTTLNSGSGSYLQYVHFFDLNNGIAVGYTGVVLRTTNAGESWFLENTGTTENFFSCILLSPTIAIIGGENGFMMKNKNLVNGVGQVEAPSMAYKIYPNPTAGLFYWSSDQTINSIKVFDLLGRLVFESAAGASETVIDLSNNAPGVYYVQAQRAGALYSTKVVRE